MSEAEGVKTEELAFRSFKWSVLWLLAPKITQAVLGVVLAWLVTPEDFGIVAVCSSVLFLGLAFQDLGLSRAVMNAQDSLEDVANFAFWANLIFGVTLMLLVAGLAPLAAESFRDSRFVAALRVQSLGFLIAGFSIVQETLLRKDLKFREVFFRNLASILIPFVVTLPLAALGFGYWALIVGSLSGSLARALFLWTGTTWRPHLGIDWPVARRTLRFGVTSSVEVLQSWAINMGDRLFLGYALGAVALGQYSLSSSLVATIFLVPAVALPVGFSTFCLLQDEHSRPRLRRAFNEITQVTALLAIPLALGAWAVADTFVAVALGPEWQGIGPVIGLLAVYPGLSIVLSPMGDLFTAKGRPDLMPKINAVVIAYMIPSYAIGVQYGLLGFTIAKVSQVVVAPLMVVAAARLLNAPVASLLRVILTPLLAGIAVAGSVWSAKRLIGPIQGPTPQNVATLLALVALGAAVYVAALYRLDPELVHKSIARARRALRGDGRPDELAQPAV